MATMHGQEDLLARFVYDHVIDHHVLSAHAQQGSNFNIEVVKDCAPFKCLSTPQLVIRLIRKGLAKIKGMYGARLAVANEQHSAGVEGQCTSGLQVYLLRRNSASGG
jgi:hypothetical protein